MIKLQFTAALILMLFSSITLKGQSLSVKSFGASGCKDQNAGQYIQMAIDSCYNVGGGEVLFPPGDYTSGTIVLKDGVTLNVQTGATLWASLDPEDYYNPFSLDDHVPNEVFIYAKNASNISVKGKGSINGQARRIYYEIRGVDNFIADITENARLSGVEMKKWYKLKPITRLLVLEGCRNINISEISLIESNSWTLHLKWCDEVRITGIKIFSSLEKGVNADGLDIDGCRNVIVSDCHIETGDDAIVLKTTATNGISRPCENITVTNCILTSTSTALKLGTESRNDFRYIQFSDCIIRNTNRGLSIVIRDGATAEFVNFSDIIMECNRKPFFWWGNGDPIWLVVKKRDPDSKIGTIRNVTFNNISARGQGTSRIEGFDDGHPLENIHFSNVNLSLSKEDLPDKRADDILNIHHVKNISLNAVSLTWDNSEGKEDKWRYALSIDQVNDLVARNLIVDPVPESSGIPPIRVSNTQNAEFSHLFSRQHPDIMIDIETSSCSDVKIGD